jgi:hypothetical protein
MFSWPFSRFGKTIVLALSILLLTMPVLAQQVTDDCLRAKQDGKTDGKAAGNALWLLAGFGCGCIGLGAALIFTPSPHTERLVGKSSDYVLCYTQSFKSAARGKQAAYAAVGWGIWIIVYAAFILPSESD